MRKLNSRIFLWLNWGLIGLLTTCDTAPLDPQPALLGFQYYPLVTGQFIDYEVEEVFYSLTEAPQVTQYLLREEVLESFVDIQGDTAYRLRRSRRDNINQPWQTDSIWSTKITAAQALKTENNITFVKLVFPTEEGKTWNGNNFNALSREEYRMANVGTSFAIDTINFSNTLRVFQSNACSLVDLDRRDEVYAQGVGLIYQADWQLRFDVNTACIDLVNAFCEDSLGLALPPLPEAGCVESGNTYTQKIISYGKIQ